MTSPPGPGPAPPAVSANVSVQLSDATNGAKAEFAAAVQAYASSLANEAQRQEISARPSGIVHPEVTSNSMVRAKQVLDRYGARAKPSRLDLILLAASPLSGAATGVLGGYLQSPVTIVLFAISAAFTAFLAIFLPLRRL